MAYKSIFRPQRRSRARVVAIVAVVIVVILLAAGALSRPKTAPESTNSEQGPEIAHVHGLGVNPGDGDLYVATHTGTFRITGADRAKRVGGSYQDTMGFTVAGPDRFVGSGHPDVPSLRQGQPPLLGLIESTDAGETWTTRSLSGEADFHGLAFAHERVYGLDSTSGAFMVTEDLSTWDRRSQPDLLGFAVDPADPDHIVGAGVAGLLDSRDGGRTWASVDGPGIAALSWDPDTGLWGLNPDGTLHRRGVDGATWQPAGPLPGQPEALLADDGVLYAATLDGEDGTAIHRSDDEGATWGLLYRDKS